MKIDKTDLEDVCIITPDIFKDYRGEYIETFDTNNYLSLTEFVQDDVSISYKNVIRGLHGDQNTTKLIQCLYGRILLTVLDCNPDSKTYLEHIQIILDDKTRQQVLVPSLKANGHLCLSDQCIFSYKQSTHYKDQKQFTIKYDAYDIKWPIDHKNIILSERDKYAKNKLENL